MGKWNRNKIPVSNFSQDIAFTIIYRAGHAIVDNVLNELTDDVQPHGHGLARDQHVIKKARPVTLNPIEPPLKGVDT